MSDETMPVVPHEAILAAYSRYGEVNGVGLTRLNASGKLDAEGDWAYAVGFVRLHQGVRKKDVPTTFEGRRVNAEVVGIIRAL